MAYDKKQLITLIKEDPLSPSTVRRRHDCSTDIESIRKLFQKIR